MSDSLTDRPPDIVISMENVPSYAKTVMVPIANPATAPLLLELALALAHPFDGTIIALIVSQGDTEQEASALAELQPIVDGLSEDGFDVRLETHVSTSVTRGILDVAREENVDLLVLGLRQPRRGEVVLGNVVQGVAQTTPSDMLIYRAADKLDFKRIVVPVDGSLDSRVALRTASMLAVNYGIPVEAFYVQTSYRPDWRVYGQIDQALADLSGNTRVRRTVIRAENWVSGILARVTNDDLIVLGVAQRGRLERWLYGDSTQDMLNRAPGPVILTKRSPQPESRSSDIMRFLKRFDLTLTDLEQEEIIWKAREMTNASLDYLVLMFIAAVIASLGLLVNSPAVIIGAMLVAPLMQPIIGFSAGISTGRLDLMIQALWTLLQGVAVALVVSFLLGLILPLDAPTSEMLARGRPTLLDAGIGLASGAIGAYATARKDIPSALAGVAIAAALVPPLCSVGLFFGLGEIILGLRASLLFLTNIVSIALTGWVIFFWLGMRPRFLDDSLRNQYTTLAQLLVLMFLVISVLLFASNQDTQTTQIDAHVKEAFAEAQVTDIEITPTEDHLHVVATLRSPTEIDMADVARVESSLTALVEEPVKFEVVVLSVVPASDDEIEETGDAGRYYLYLGRSIVAPVS